jgi:IS30 family transposase
MLSILSTITHPMRKTLTYDQGKDMALHKQLTINTSMAVYFCDPHSPWQRGSNGNTNGLVRQYLPYGTDLSGYSQVQLDARADEINNRTQRVGCAITLSGLPGVALEHNATMRPHTLTGL